MCAIEGCEGPVRSRGWCRKHYDRWLRHGDPLAGDPPKQRAPADGKCTIEGCGNLHYARGWCNKHYLRWKHHGDPLAVLPPSGGCPSGHPAHERRYHPSGPEHPHWAGDAIGYGGLHNRVRQSRGPAAQHDCSHADETCKGPMHWASISHEYRGVEDFMPLCQSHHYRYDRKAGVWGRTATRMRNGTV